MARKKRPQLPTAASSSSPSGAIANSGVGGNRGKNAPQPPPQQQPQRWRQQGGKRPSALVRRDGRTGAAAAPASHASAIKKTRKAPRSKRAPARLPTVRVLALARAQQDRNGLQHSDYDRYAKYCARRLRRLRTGTSYTCGFSAKSSRYAPAPVDAAVLDECAGGDARYLELLLNQAERAWAQAMHVKEDLAVTSTKLAGAAAVSGAGGRDSDNGAEDEEERRREVKVNRQRRYVLRRLAKAKSFADALASACVSSAWVDARTTVEARAYAAWMGGMRALERGEWSDARRALGTALVMYREMARGAGSPPREYRERVAELEAAVRFCERNGAPATGGPSGVSDLPSAMQRELDAAAAAASATTTTEAAAAVDDDDNGEQRQLSGATSTAAAAAAASSSSTSSPAAAESVPWCGRRVPVADASMRLALSRAHAALDSGRVNGALRLFDECLAKLSAELGARSAAGTATTDADTLRLLEAYVRYQRICIVASRAVRRQAFDVAESAAEQAAELFGIDAQLHDQCGIDAQVFRARRAARAAQRMYERGAYVEAYALCSHAIERASIAASALQHVDEGQADAEGRAPESLSGASAERVAVVVREARAMRCRAQAQHALEQARVAEDMQRKARVSESRRTAAAATAVSGGGAGGYMVDGMDAFVAAGVDGGGARVAPMPPRMVPVPGKPVLLDLALDGVQFPQLVGVEEEAEAAEGEEGEEGDEEDVTATSAVGGVFARASRWLGM